MKKPQSDCEESFVVFKLTLVITPLIIVIINLNSMLCFVLNSVLISSPSDEYNT